MILKFAPNCHKALWGEENWLVSALPASPSVPSSELALEYPGTLADIAPSFPLLAKTIDAKKRLSLQVHPNERTSLVTGGAPKTEMWFALNDGAVYAGLKRGVGPNDIKRAIANHSFEDLLLRYELKRGEAMLIPGGLVHTICEGTQVYEIQQSSDTTFRLYDWGRVGPDGKPRELHILRALAAIDYDLPAPQIVRDVECEYFSFRQLEVKGEVELPRAPYTILYVFRGEVLLAGEKLVPGDCRLIMGEDERLVLASEDAEVLATTTTAKGRARQ